MPFSALLRRLTSRHDQEPTHTFHSVVPQSLDDAHRAMQIHRRCDKTCCTAKMNAWRTLIAAGKLVPTAKEMDRFGIAAAPRPARPVRAI